MCQSVVPHSPPRICFEEVFVAVAFFPPLPRFPFPLPPPSSPLFFSPFTPFPRFLFVFFLFFFFFLFHIVAPVRSGDYSDFDAAMRPFDLLPSFFLSWGRRLWENEMKRNAGLALVGAEAGCALKCLICDHQ